MRLKRLCEVLPIKAAPGSKGERSENVVKCCVYQGFLAPNINQPTSMNKHCITLVSGRLFLQAFAVQSFVTGEGPYANWAKHVSDPFGYNLLSVCYSACHSKGVLISFLADSFD